MANSTRAELNTAVSTALADGQPITAEILRDFLNADTNNVFDELYPTVLTDTQATETYLTLDAGANASTFSIQITKQGRLVTLNGLISITQSFVTLGVIASGVLDAKDDSEQYGMGITFNDEAVGFSITRNSGGDSQLRFKGGVLAGETIRIHLTYNTED